MGICWGKGTGVGGGGQGAARPTTPKIGSLWGKVLSPGMMLAHLYIPPLWVPFAVVCFSISLWPTVLA